MPATRTITRFHSHAPPAHNPALTSQVSSATLPRVGGGAPPYFFLQAIALRDDGGDARATSRGAQERPSTKQLTYSVAEARGMSPEQLARAASREPEEASAALTRYAARRQQSRMA